MGADSGDAGFATAIGVVDIERLSAPVASSEIVEMPWQTFYHLPQFAKMTETELEGVRSAFMSMLHFEIDGHSSTTIVATEHRAELQRDGKGSLVQWPPLR